MDFKTVCFCHYKTEMGTDGKIVLTRKEEPKCQMHGWMAQEKHG